MHHKKVLLLKSELIQVGCHYGNSKMTLRLAYIQLYKNFNLVRISDYAAAA